MANIGVPIDWHYWRNMQEVELWQACLLSLNINPDTMQHDSDGWMNGPQDAPFFEPESFSSYQSRDDYRKRLNLLRSNLSKTEFFSSGKFNMRRPNYCGVRLPEFAAWAIVIELSLPSDLESMACSPTIPKEKNVTTEEKPLSTTERNTLLKIILGMAIDSYQFDPKAARSDVPKSISDDILKHGISVSDDTIRKHLKAASELI